MLLMTSQEVWAVDDVTGSVGCWSCLYCSHRVIVCLSHHVNSPHPVYWWYRGSLLLCWTFSISLLTTVRMMVNQSTTLLLPVNPCSCVWPTSRSLAASMVSSLCQVSIRHSSAIVSLASNQFIAGVTVNVTVNVMVNFMKWWIMSHNIHALNILPELSALFLSIDWLISESDCSIWSAGRSTGSQPQKPALSKPTISRADKSTNTPSAQKKLDPETKKPEPSGNDSSVQLLQEMLHLQNENRTMKEQITPKIW